MSADRRRLDWLEELDDLINRVPDLRLPGPVADQLQEQLAQIEETVNEQFELRSTEWE
jgi:hypothetical protein